MCKVNLIHAAILYEYLKCPTPEQELQRCVIKIDFGPAHKAYSIVGKGKAKVEEYIGEEAIRQNIKNLVVGPFWYSETENVLATFKRIENEIEEGKRVPTYSSSGSGSSGRERKVVMQYSIENPTTSNSFFFTVCKLSDIRCESFGTLFQRFEN